MIYLLNILYYGLRLFLIILSNKHKSVYYGIKYNLLTRFFQCIIIIAVIYNKLEKVHKILRFCLKYNDNKQNIHGLNGSIEIHLSKYYFLFSTYHFFPSYSLLRKVLLIC